MTTAEREQHLLPPKLTVEEADMARAAQRCIMAALDHSKAATITLESDDGSQPAIQLPPQALRFIAQLLEIGAVQVQVHRFVHTQSVHIRLGFHVVLTRAHDSRSINRVGKRTMLEVVFTPRDFPASKCSRMISAARCPSA